MMNFRGMGLLLYLAPGENNYLLEQLQKLEMYLAKTDASASVVPLIRKNLFDLIYPLSPISKTRKLVIEILELTGKNPVIEKIKIIELILLVEEIYPSLKSIHTNKQVLARTGSA